jgi:hypothetical protein
MKLRKFVSGIKNQITNFCKLSLIGVIFYLIASFCERQTDGFSIAFIHSDLTYNPAWETKSISKETRTKLATVFSQKFRYLGYGGQSFAFVSEDNEYVVKFFKHRRFRKPHSFFVTLPLPSVLEHSRLRKLNRAIFKLNRDFTSYKLAYEQLQEETGLIYIHLNKGTKLKQRLCIVDKIGIEHEIDLDRIEFIIQRRADPIYSHIDELVAKGDLTGVKKTLHSILEVIVNRCKKGIFDEDLRIHNNIGLIGQRAIFIDVGRFVQDPKRSLPSVYMNDLKTVIDERLRPWLETEHPQLVAYLNEQLMEVLSHERE